MIKVLPSIAAQGLITSVLSARADLVSLLAEPVDGFSASIYSMPAPELSVTPFVTHQNVPGPQDERYGSRDPSDPDLLAIANRRYQIQFTVPGNDDALAGSLAAIGVDALDGLAVEQDGWWVNVSVTESTVKPGEDRGEVCRIGVLRVEFQLRKV